MSKAFLISRHTAAKYSQSQVEDVMLFRTSMMKRWCRRKPILFGFNNLFDSKYQ